MTSRSRVETTSKAYNSSINSVTDASSCGDSPHAEFVAGMTAGEIGKGHAAGHADYLGRVKSMEIYTGKAPASGSVKGDSGLGDVKDVLGIIKTFLG
jgi:hypothetical protein